MAQEGWVGMDEVTTHLQVAKESIYRWTKSKGFPVHRIGRLFRFKLSEVDKWVKQMQENSIRSKRAKSIAHK